jgi:hypothetical protein
MTSQVKTRGGTLKSTMTRVAFVRGFKEAREGLPMDYDAFTTDGDTNARWQYERGRQFGIVYAGDLKQGPRVTWQAVEAMHGAVLCQWIR